MEHQIEIPLEWHAIDDYGSHLPMLYYVIMRQYQDGGRGNVTEMGCGLRSSCMLAALCGSLEIQYDFYETNKEWYDLIVGKLNEFGFYPESWLIKSYLDVEITEAYLFIDTAPGEERKNLIEKHANKAAIVIVHDTEIGAEYVYHMADALSKFKYRLDLHIEGMPSTTAVSNYIDLNQWKGQYNGYYFV